MRSRNACLVDREHSGWWGKEDTLHQIAWGNWHRLKTKTEEREQTKKNEPNRCICVWWIFGNLPEVQILEIADISLDTRPSFSLPTNGSRRHTQNNTNPSQHAMVCVFYGHTHDTWHFRTKWLNVLTPFHYRHRCSAAPVRKSVLFAKA